MVLGQEVIIIDNSKNPIINVSAFNINKTKSVLSDGNGVINLSRFLPSDTIVLQHPNYRVRKLLKSNVGEFIELELEYQLLENITVSENKNTNNIKNDAEKKINISLCFCGKVDLLNDRFRNKIPSFF